MTMHPNMKARNAQIAKLSKELIAKGFCVNHYKDKENGDWLEVA